MKWITYQIAQSTVGEEDILITKKVGYSEANLAIAEAEAYDGYTIEDDEKAFSTTTEFPGDADMTGHKIKNLGEPTDDSDAATLGKTKELISSVENDVAVIDYAVGSPSKNLLNHTAKTETVNGVNITVNADGSITFAGTFTGTDVYYHQIYRNADGSNKTIGKGKYIVSGGVEEFGFFVKHGTNFSGNNGTQFNVKTSDVPITIENETERIEFFVPLYPAREYNATIYPMLRPADITDNTYEPYVPSVNERLVEVENNKLNLNFGYVYLGYQGNTGWKRLAHCEWSPSDSGEFRDTTLYIEKMGNEGSVEYEGLLKFILRASKKGNVYSCDRVDGYTLINKGLDTNEIVMVAKVEGTIIIAEIWCKISYLYTGYRATMISATTRGVTVNFGTPSHWSLDKAGTSVLAQESYPNWEKKATITDYYGDIIKGLSDRLKALEEAYANLAIAAQEGANSV